ncbi:uncharacterized protein SAPINGB_P005173 [Magnusiomyces paraingens]|uniref:Rad21/Rec8-like protein N-terminal domain-containing protein n=1 Tax=Magnusiomyces paraingens TaxID=2606893 RepID=A0A5E8BYU8_9ASCO|nr:uncharacterized protein SAPINGB_P005173 [Saprochaete ingens]VVT56604.1 unnamed protein product [Saprochaete ingens]
MFYSENLLSNDGPLAQVWLAANMEKKVTRQQFIKTDISTSVHAIVDSSGVPLALRLSGQLLLGVVRIYNKKASYLAEDCKEILLKLRMAFRPGNVDMDQDTVAVAKTQTLTLQNKVTDLDLLLLPDPNFDFDQDFVGSSLMGRRNVDEEGTSLLISSQVASQRRDITLADMDDTVDVGRGRAKNDLDDLDDNQDLDLGLNFDEEVEEKGTTGLDLDLEGLSPVPGAEEEGEEGEGEEEGYDMGTMPDIQHDEHDQEELDSEVLKKRREAFEKQIAAAGLEDEDVELGLSAPPQRPEGEDIEAAGEVAFKDVDVDMPDVEHPITGPTDANADFEMPLSPSGPATPPQTSANLLGNIQIAGEEEQGEEPAMSLIEGEGKADDEVSIMTSQMHHQQLQNELQQQQRQRRRPQGPRHAHIDRMTEMETSSLQMQQNRESIIRTDRRMLPADPAMFSLLALANDQTRFLQAMFQSSPRQHPEIARLIAPDYVSQMMKRKRSLSDVGGPQEEERRAESEEGSKSPEVRAPSVGELDLDLEGIVVPPLEQDESSEEEEARGEDMGGMDFGVEEGREEPEVSEEVLAKRREAFQKQIEAAGIEEDEEEQVGGTIAAKLPEEELAEEEEEEGGAGKEEGFGAPSPREEEEEEEKELKEEEEEEEEEIPLAMPAEEEEGSVFYGASSSAAASGVSQYTIKAAQMIRQHIPEEVHVDGQATQGGSIDFDGMLGSSASKSTRVKMFFEVLVLATKDAIKVKQEHAFGEIKITAKRHLYDDIWNEEKDGDRATTREDTPADDDAGGVGGEDVEFLGGEPVEGPIEV